MTSSILWVLGVVVWAEGVEGWVSGFSSLAIGSIDTYSAADSGSLRSCGPTANGIANDVPQTLHDAMFHQSKPVVEVQYSVSPQRFYR